MTINKSLQRAIDALFIEDFVLKSIETKLGDGVYPGVNLPPGTAVSVQQRALHSLHIDVFENEDNADEKLVVFEMSGGVRILRGTRDDLATFSKEDVDQFVLATIDTSFLVYYQLRPVEGDEIDNDSLSEFGKHNVPFQLWPYWREVVHSACSRMGLPRIVLPTHRLKRSVETVTSQANRLGSD